VECTGNSDCKDAAQPYCVDQECVQCRSHADCDNPTPQCNGSGECVGCTAPAACTGRPEGERCATAAGALQGRCVECRSHADCDNPTPQCNSSGQCVPCTVDAACSGRSATPVCDESSDATYGGRCVPCTGAKYASCEKTGTAYVCESLTRTCSTTAVAGLAAECSPCVSDAHCQSSKLCVMQSYNDPFDNPNQGAVEVGYFCAWRKSAPSGPNGSCFSARPYVKTVAGVSIDGTAADVCVLRVSTCPALTDYSSKNCGVSDGMGGLMADDALCGDPDLHDGYCAEPETGTFLCTTLCLGDTDCKLGASCDTSPEPDTCSL
jgi:hypothetical protein